MSEFAFDIALFAAVRVKAENEAEARKMLDEHFSCADCNGGAWPNGDPVLFEASLVTTDTVGQEPILYEIDGKETQ